MKKVNFIFISLVFVNCLSADVVQIKQDGIKYIKMLGSELKKNLVAKLEADPNAKEALEFCTTAATNITKEVNKKLPSNATVYRTALKYRNQTNKPDIIDSAIMKLYIKKNNLNEVIMIKTKDDYRVYKPLVINQLCLKCHGQISDKLKISIKEAYPNDLATGFKDGDFRGVIVSKINQLDNNK